MIFKNTNRARITTLVLQMGFGWSRPAFYTRRSGSGLQIFRLRSCMALNSEILPHSFLENNGIALQIEKSGRGPEMDFGEGSWFGLPNNRLPFTLGRFDSDGGSKSVRKV